MRFKTAAILSVVLVGGILFVLPAVVEGVFLPSLKQGLPNPIPGYEQVLLYTASFVHRYRWLLLPLTVLVLFFIAAFSSESVRRQGSALSGAKRIL